MQSAIARRCLVLLTAFTALVAVASTAHAQCVRPDNLNGPCWQPVNLNIPQFPDITNPGLGICWTLCIPTTNPVNVIQTTPVPTAVCGQFTSSVSVVNATTGVTDLFGSVILDYTRTWEEMDTSGRQYQVWRFAAKVDFSNTVGAVPRCPVPTCLPPFGPHPTAFFYGYVDYSIECTIGLTESSLVLFHNCDAFIHQPPALSSRPGAFHPATTYAVVSPNTSTNPFTPTSPALLPTFPSGPLMVEAVRNVNNPAGLPFCVAEEPLLDGDLMPLVFGCPCGASLLPQVSANLFKGSGVCIGPISGGGSSFEALFFAILPWLFYDTTSIGSWTTDFNYPGQENAFVGEGLFQYHDSCQELLPPPVFTDFAEIFYGGQTTGGRVVLPNPLFPPLTQNFVDLADNYSTPIGGPPPPLPIYGAVEPTDHLIYVNPTMP